MGFGVVKRCCPSTISRVETPPVRNLFQHQRTEEVAAHGRIRAGQNPVTKIVEILPKRLPVLLSLPDVGALEQRHDVALASEDLHEGQVIWLRSNKPFQFEFFRTSATFRRALPERQPLRDVCHR